MILANPPRIVFDLVLPEDEIAAKQEKSSRAAAAPKAKPAPAKPVAKAEPKPAPAKPVAKAEPKPAPAKPVAKAEPKPAPAKPEPKPAPVAKAEPVKPAPPAPQADTPKAAVTRTSRSSERKSAAPQTTPEKAALPFPIPDSVKAQVDSEIPIPPPGAAQPDPAERPDPGAQPPAEDPELAAARPTPEPETKTAEPRPEAVPAPKPRPAAKPVPVARTAPSEAAAESLDFVLWGGAAAGVLFLLVVIVLLMRRRRLPNDSEVTAVAEEDGEGPIPAGGFSMDAPAESVGPLFEDVPTGEAAGERPISQERARTVEMDIAAGPGLFDEDEPEKESDKMDLEGQDLPQDSESPTQIGVGAAGGGDLATLVRDLERRMAQLETRLDESTEARERLERQVAAQAEELRVQRAAIARTQRALRSLNRPAEEQATEPALRDQS